MTGVSIKLIKAFLDKDSSKPLTTGEMVEFWKACSDAEKVQFTREAAELMPGIAVPA